MKNRANQRNAIAGMKSIVITLAFVFLFVVAVLLDLQYLYLMAVTLAVLPLASYAIAYFFAARFSGERLHLDTAREGKAFHIQLKLRSRGGLPQTTVRIREAIPAFLLLEGRDDPEIPLKDWNGREGYAEYALIPQKRGVHQLGPTNLETTDPLGLFTFTATIPVQSTMVVLPEPLPMYDSAQGGEGTYGLRERDGKTRRGDGMDFHGVREYRMGDPLRRVHWPSSARRGHLVVVEHERAYQQDTVIALDLSKDAEYGVGRETTLEYAIKAAATLADRTLAAGGGVTLVTQRGHLTVRPSDGDPAVGRFQLLNTLAGFECDAVTSLSEALQGLPPESGRHWAVLTSEGDSKLTGFLNRRVQLGDSVNVFFFEPSSFGGPLVTSPAVAGAELRIIERQHSPWEEGGRWFERIIRETI